MRIIAGSKRGMKLLAPGTRLSRPITDRVKESLFSVLCKYGCDFRKADAMAEGKIVADLFSGVGSIGLEALSRGAAFVVFVEKDPETIVILKKNIAKAGFIESSEVIKTNAFEVSSAAGFNKQKYDIIFVDPPYAVTRQTEADSPVGGLLICLSGYLAEGGIVVVRTHRRTKLLERYGRLSAGHLTVEAAERRQWGTMAVTIFQRTDK